MMTTPTNHDAEVIRRATRDGADAHNAVARAQGRSVSYGHALADGDATNPHDHDGPDCRLHHAFAVGYGWAAVAYGQGREHGHLPLMANLFGDFGPFSEAYALGWERGAGDYRKTCELNGVALPPNFADVPQAPPAPVSDILRHASITLLSSRQNLYRFAVRKADGATEYCVNAEHALAAVFKGTPEQDLLTRRLAVAEAVRDAALDALDDDQREQVQAVADAADAEHGNPYMPT